MENKISFSRLKYVHVYLLKNGDGYIDIVTQP